MTPVQNILVAIDFSAGSELALSQARMLAERPNTRLHLCHIAKGEGLDAPVSLGMSIPDDFPEAKEARALLEHTRALLGSAIDTQKEPGIMQRPPRDPKRPILTFPLFMRTGLVSLIILGGAFGLFLLEERHYGASLAAARTVVVNVIVAVEAVYLLSCRSLLHPMWQVGLFSNRWVFPGIAAMLGAQILFTYLPVMNRLFHTTPISAASWTRICGVALLAYLVVEFEKWIRWRGRTRWRSAAAD